MWDSGQNRTSASLRLVRSSRISPRVVFRRAANIDIACAARYYVLLFPRFTKMKFLRWDADVSIITNSGAECRLHPCTRARAHACDNYTGRCKHLLRIRNTGSDEITDCDRVGLTYGALDNGLPDAARPRLNNPPFVIVRKVERDN